MPEKESKVSTDPELKLQMEAASAKDGAVEAVFILSPDNPSEVVPSPERTEELTRKLLDRVKARVGEGEKRVNIFRNMGSFAVSAHPSFLRELMSQPEIATAMANQQPGAVVVRPVKKRPVPSTHPRKTGGGKKTTLRRARAKATHPKTKE